MRLTQLDYKYSNPKSDKNFDYSNVQMLVILFIHTKKLTTTFSLSQLPKNMDESFFKHFMEHCMDVREIS